MANYFSIFLVALTAISGAIWLLDALLWAPKRKEKIALATANTQGTIDIETIEKIAPVPHVVDTAQQFFPVIAFVLVLRSFLYEPFQIPSGSMMPTLLVGDFILVEKFTYGLKDPVMRKKFVDIGKPERGDIVVFKFPENPNVDFIKRVVGMPGDTLIYKNQQVFVRPACPSNNNCQPMQPVKLELVDRGAFEQQGMPLDRFVETLGNIEHEILRNPRAFQQIQHYYTQEGEPVAQWQIPEDQYFVLGDNRDNSRDSRYWGFVPDELLVGKAVAIWISFEFERPASSTLPSWVPTGVRFNRVGGIH